MIDLHEARLCVSCEAVFSERSCPRCGSDRFLCLSGIIGSLANDKNSAPKPGIISLVPGAPGVQAGAHSLSGPRRPRDGNGQSIP